jgi:hypothetical protein
LSGGSWVSDDEELLHLVASILNASLEVGAHSALAKAAAALCVDIHTTHDVPRELQA